MRANTRTILAAAVFLLGGISVLAATNVEKALTDADGRRKAAENGLREIRAKSADQGTQVRPLYGEAASRNNTWLETVCQSIQQGAPAAPDVGATAESAAAALVQWVSVRNRALGVADLTGALADSVKKQVTQDLTDIANGLWKNNRSANEQKRMKAAADLKERLRWRTWQEIQ